MSRIDRVLEIALGATFLVAGTLKVLDPGEFALTLSRLRILPAVLVGAAAILLPWVELVSGAALIATRRYRDAATWLILGLLVVFSLVLLGELQRGEWLSCGCLGPGVAILNRPDVGLVRNGLLIAAAVFLIARRRKPTSRSGPASPA